MDFISILIAWAAVQFWGSGGVLQQDGWFRQWRQWLSGLPGAGLRVALAVILPALLVAVVLLLVQNLLLGLLSLILSVVLLLYSLGRGDFQIQLRLYLNSWLRGDLEGAYCHGQSFSAELNEMGADNALELHNSVRRAVLYQGFERWFAVVFWFVLLGPAAALAYRLLFLIAADKASTQDERNLSGEVLYYLEWVPARLLGFAFGLVGNFERCFSRWRGLLGGPAPAIDILDELAACALPDYQQQGQIDDEQFMKGSAEELEAIQNLLSRSLLCWISVIAVLQLI